MNHLKRRGSSVIAVTVNNGRTVHRKGDSVAGLDPLALIIDHKNTGCMGTAVHITHGKCAARVLADGLSVQIDFKAVSTPQAGRAGDLEFDVTIAAVEG